MELASTLIQGASSSIIDRLEAFEFDPGCLRPFKTGDGKAAITIYKRNRRGDVLYDNEGNAQEETVLLQNANASLRKDEWLELDREVISAARERLALVADIRSTGLVYNVPDGFGVSAIQTQTQSDITAATINMDGVAQGDADRLEFGLNNLPLPIIHKDFRYTLREVRTGRRAGTPIDTTHAGMAGIRVAEEAEKWFIGTGPAFTFAGGTVYGAINFPDRLTKTFTTPDGTNQTTTVDEFLQAINQIRLAHHHGPFMVYTGTSWDQWLDADYSADKGDNTLRERLIKIRQITDVRPLDFLSGYNLIFLEMRRNIVRLVNGMDMMTLQWEGQGGLHRYYKVMAIWVPQYRSDHNGNTGLLHGSV